MKEVIDCLGFVLVVDGKQRGLMRQVDGGTVNGVVVEGV